MFSDVGAQAAAEEILKTVEKVKKQNRTKEESLAAIEKKVREIIEAAKAGWF
jgi:hypothetical protein